MAVHLDRFEEYPLAENGEDLCFQESTPQYHLNQTTLLSFRNRATSRRNFAVMCMRVMFTEEERVHTNISGLKGRAKLDPTGERLEKIYQYVMSMYDVPQTHETIARRECHLAMDEANRKFRSRATNI